MVWDVDKNGLIDTLELFSGLILFSDSKLEDKIRCKKPLIIVLFDVFDLNELNSLAPIDIELMIYSCLSSTFKIFGIKTEVNIDEIKSYTNSHFQEQLRVNIT